ncbi:exodeoxyribonuclease VII [Acinetobacter guillouiae]|uniref:exodeoxyribonuclease VII small subunit n=1 Tax=Acinetobacter guillouiae TaxID=106649 RepID=UPI0021D3E798|nr:exodeoxyribonuclease VII small subunit [Acinetobacter guillouiae]MCU4491814.1 exodeoxyribonuclease VII [Acinetobacter guillouiae]
MTKKELTFKDGYEILKKNAELLESQEEPDIDNLMKIVEESMTAYKACKSRVDAVQRALNETFNEEIKIQSADVKL